MKRTMQSHYITPDQLAIGYYVHLDLGWMDHPFTFSNFMIKNEDQIAKIRALNLWQIRYDPMRSTVAPEFPKTVIADWSPKAEVIKATPSPVERSNRLKQLNDARINCEQEFAKNANATREALRILIHHPEHAKAITENLVNDMVNSIITESDVTLHTINSGSVGNSTHPLNVAVLALMLAKSTDMKEEESAMLGMAAIFHDIGKTDNQPLKSSVNLHCEAGYRIALRSGLTERVAKIILQHHEYSDGTGYPMHLVNNDIDELARILVIANYYDNLCNPSDQADAMTPYEALQHMYVYKSQKFDEKLLKRLVKLLGVYPAGSIIQLSNGTYGTVMTVNYDKPLLPSVMIYAPEVARETPVIIDLSEESNLTIQHCLNPKKLPPEVFNYLKPSKRICYYFLKNQGSEDTMHLSKNNDTIGEPQQDQVYQEKRIAKA